jgi:putative protease
MAEKLIGKITHYFNKIGVAVIEITDDHLKIGDKIKVKGPHTEFDQTMTSMQVEHQNVEKANAGEAIGMKVDQAVREGDEVYKIEE